MSPIVRASLGTPGGSSRYLTAKSRIFDALAAVDLAEGRSHSPRDDD